MSTTTESTTWIDGLLFGEPWRFRLNGWQLDVTAHLGTLMRRTRLELVCPKAPDPKSGTLAGSLTNQEASRVTDARSAPPSDARTTTNPTTCAVSSSLRRSESGQ